MHAASAGACQQTTYKTHACERMRGAGRSQRSCTAGRQLAAPTLHRARLHAKNQHQKSGGKSPHLEQLRGGRQLLYRRCTKRGGGSVCRITFPACGGRQHTTLVGQGIQQRPLKARHHLNHPLGINHAWCKQHTMVQAATVCAPANKGCSAMQRAPDGQGRGRQAGTQGGGGASRAHPPAVRA